VRKLALVPALAVALIAAALVGPLFFARGGYLLYLPPRSGIACRRASVLFTRPRRSPAGALAREGADRDLLQASASAALRLPRRAGRRRGPPL